jgi:type II secretory pathway component PulJ
MAAPALIALGAIQGFAAFQQTATQNKQLRYRALIARRNAKIARTEGKIARDISRLVSADSRRQTDQLLGFQRSKMAASGFVVGEGSFGDILDTTAVLGEIDALTILYEGELEQFRREQEARALEAESRALKGAQTDPFLSGVLAFGSSAGARSITRG